MLIADDGLQSHAVSALTALSRRQSSKAVCRFPHRDDDARSSAGLIFPQVRAGFQFCPQDQIFTMGSCFARNIEEHLQAYNIPTTQFSVPKSEFDRRPNGLLNEYNPASMAQRLVWAAAGFDTRQVEDAAHIDADRCIDLLLPNGSGVTLERLLQRRAEIDAIYAQLRSCKVLIMTLGLVECWFDNKTHTWLNRAPHPRFVKQSPERFSFVRLNADQSTRLLEAALQDTFNSGVRNILLTVSPVPLGTTFSGTDCVLANSYSKATLRVVAENLSHTFSNQLDYFPSYEIVSSGGLSAFIGDQIHVKDEVVQRVVNYMLSHYERKGSSTK